MLIGSLPELATSQIGGGGLLMVMAPGSDFYPKDRMHTNLLSVPCNFHTFSSIIGKDARQLYDCSAIEDKP